MILLCLQLHNLKTKKESKSIFIKLLYANMLASKSKFSKRYRTKTIEYMQIIYEVLLSINLIDCL